MSSPALAHRNARYLSALTHPLFMPVIGFWVFNHFNYSSFHGQSLLVILSAFTITVVALPAYFVYALKRSGSIQTYEMESIQERRLPLLFTSAALLFNYYLMRHANLTELYQWYFLSTTAACILSLGITLFYKISLHTLGIGFLFGLGFTLSYLNNSDLRWYLIGIVLLGGIVGYCRYLLKAHTLPQLYLGFIVGTFSSSLLLLFG